MKLVTDTPEFQAFPEPGLVFSQPQCVDFLLPLALMDLALIDRNWSGKIPLLMPIGPESGVIGEETSEYHTYYCRDNWFAYRVNAGKAELCCDFHYFDREGAEDHYRHVKAYFEKRKGQYRQLGKLFSCQYGHRGESIQWSEEPCALFDEVGGEPSDGNWSNMDNFPLSFERQHSAPDHGASPHPLTEDGRLFHYVGRLSMYDYLAADLEVGYSHTADMLVFYDPETNIVLTTFDWS